MRMVRLACLVVVAVVYVVALAPTDGAAKPLCCFDYASFCSSECQPRAGIYTLDCPFPGFQICVCNDYYSPSGGPDCP